MLADGFDEALIGTVSIAMRSVAVYDIHKCIQILMERDGMEHEEAVDFFMFNVASAYVGEGTPAFAVLTDDDEEGQIQ